MSSVGRQHETTGSGHEEELRRFADLQAKLPQLFREQFSDPLVPRTVIVVPSLSFDPEELAKISGVHHYEERMLCMLMLLRLPKTHVIYLTSQALDPSVIDYQLHLLAGVPSNHARQRLHLFHTGDASAVSLSQKLLARPRLIARIREAVPDLGAAHMTCFTSTALERSLAVALGVPLYACDPALLHLGTKSGSREIMREAGVTVADGFENLRDGADVVDGLVALKTRNPELRRAVVKLNDGFSGEGNALFSFDGCGDDVRSWVARELPLRLRFEAKGETWERFEAKFREMQGIVECFIEGEVKHSPSAQFRINPLGEPAPVSTHDQVLGGPSGQVFIGARFPAYADYRLDVQRLGAQVAEVVCAKGVTGRFAVDFVSVLQEGSWRHYGVEINLRKGGTTHPMMVLHFLTDGHYDEATGMFMTPAGRPRYYFASDNVKSDRYRGLLPEDLIDITVCNQLHFHGATQQGVAFHLIGALSEFGKLGMVCIGDSPDSADGLYNRTVEVLDQETLGADSVSRCAVAVRR